MYHRIKTQLACLSLSVVAFWSSASPKAISFSQSSESVEAYDYIELVAHVRGPDASNPFMDATLVGSFSKTDDSKRTQVDGFCDSADGSDSAFGSCQPRPATILIHWATIREATRLVTMANSGRRWVVVKVLCGSIPSIHGISSGKGQASIIFSTGQRRFGFWGGTRTESSIAPSSVSSSSR